MTFWLSSPPTLTYLLAVFGAVAVFVSAVVTWRNIELAFGWSAPWVGIIVGIVATALTVARWLY